MLSTGHSTSSLQSTRMLSEEALHIESARGQQSRALTAALKLESGSQAIIKEAASQALSVVIEAPDRQSEFGELLLKNVRTMTEGMESEVSAPIIKAATRIAESVSRYKVVLQEPCRVFTSTPPQHFATVYSQEGKKPEIVMGFNPKEPHTIPLGDYLDVRISRTIQRCVKEGMKVELFMGNKNEVEHFYKLNGDFTYKAALNTKSSIQYLLFENPEGVQKIVVLGIANESKLTHTLLQIKSLGVPDENVSIRGSIEFSLGRLERQLDEAMDVLVGEKPIALAVVGNRSQLVLEAAKRLHPNEMSVEFNSDDEREKRAVELLTKYNGYVEKDINNKIFKVSSITIGEEGNQRVLLSFRMPNGDLSRMATKAVFKRPKVEGFVMVGAGGSLREDSGVGSYQLTHSSTLQGRETIKLGEEHMMPLPFAEKCRKNASNVTVISPLVETKAWLHEHKEKATSVDVETYFIMEGLQHAMRTSEFATKVFSGLFVSDVVGPHPLVGKIDMNAAWVSLPTLLQQSLTYVEVK